MFYSYNTIHNNKIGGKQNEGLRSSVWNNEKEYEAG